jgi:hypothetical protein
MAEFKLNNGNPVDLKIDSVYNKTKIFVSVEIVPDNVAIRIAGHSIIKCIYTDTKDVVFTNYPLDYLKELYDKTLSIKIDATKFKVTEDKIDPNKIPISCKVIIEAGDDLLEHYTLDDKSDCTVNSVFIFKIQFKNQQ